MFLTNLLTNEGVAGGRHHGLPDGHSHSHQDGRPEEHVAVRDLSRAEKSAENLIYIVYLYNIHEYTE